MWHHECIFRIADGQGNTVSRGGHSPIGTHIHGGAGNEAGQRRSNRGHGGAEPRTDVVCRYPQRLRQEDVHR